MDPLFDMTLRAALALLLASAAVHKGRDLDTFRAPLADYALLPGRTLLATSIGLVIAELATSLALLLPSTARMGLAATAALLALYGGAIALNLARGRQHIDCGCFGPAARRPIHTGLVARNVVLAATAGLAAVVPIAPRVVGWVDGLGVAGGVAATASLYLAVDQLMAEAPRLRALRSDP